MAHSIQLDQDAWALLQHLRQEDESWSDLIRRCVRPKPSLAEVLSKLRESAPAEETLDAAETSTERRRAIPARKRRS